MSEQALPSEARTALLATLDELRARVATGEAVPLVLVRFSDEGAVLPTLVGNVIPLTHAVAVVHSLLVQASLQNLQLVRANAATPARMYFSSGETGQA